ncbi:MAG: MaoC/PaaZ C-terminal domain-containing protein [Myxococcota bacterium]
MTVSRKYALQQGAVVRALVRTGIASMKKNRPSSMDVPGPSFSDTVPARSQALIDAYLRHVGGSTSAYRGQVPPHLFPQWGFPTLVKTLDAIPYDMRTVLNAGCRIVLHKPIPAGEALHLRARIEEIDDNGKRALLTQKLWTSTKSAPDALEATMRVFVPLKRDRSGAPKEKPRVPEGAREIDRWRLGPKAGNDFAVLTGDFNPIHWIPAAARAAGFKNTILHGFSTMARAIETLNVVRFSGDITRLHAVDVKFTRPLVLPAKPGVFLGPDHTFFVGTHPGGPCFLEGSYEVNDG